MSDRHLWRLDDAIAPVHTHDDRDVLVHRAEDGTCRVLSGEREASEIAARGPLGDAEGLGGTQGSAGSAGSAVSRRTVLASMAALGALGVSSARPRYAFAAPPTSAGAAVTAAARDTLVVVFLRGAIDGLQVVAPVDDADYRRARPGLGIRPEDGLPIAPGFAFHPAMRPLLPMYREGQLAVVNAVGNPQATRSHFDAQLDMERAAPAAVRSGWLGRHLAATSRSTNLVRAVTVGERAAVSASGAFPTAAVGGTLEQFDLWGWEGNRAASRAAITRMNRTAGGVVAADGARALAAIGTLARARATAATATGYPDDDFGRGLREVARLIKSGAPVEAACLDLDGWDMHRDHGGPFEEWGPMRRRLDSFATGLAAFRADLGARWGRTTVVTMSEFGRRVAQNSTGGTDHGHGNLMFVAGGSVVGGRMHCAWPGLHPSALLDGDLAIATDYRDVVAEVLTKRLATPDLSAVFPGLRHRPLGIVR